MPLNPSTSPASPHVTEVVAQNDAASALRRLNPLQGELARFAPTRTYDSELSLFDGRSRVDLHHFGAGATGGDAVLVVPRFNMAYLGDLFPWKGVPLIDRELGGSAAALPETLEQAAETLEQAGVTFVLPGRAAPAVRADDTGLVQRWTTCGSTRCSAASCWRRCRSSSAAATASTTSPPASQ